jgi:hypothetical protein
VLAQVAGIAVDDFTTASASRLSGRTNSQPRSTALGSIGRSANWRWSTPVAC